MCEAPTGESQFREGIVFPAGACGDFSPLSSFRLAGCEELPGWMRYPAR